MVEWFVVCVCLFECECLSAHVSHVNVALRHIGAPWVYLCTPCQKTFVCVWFVTCTSHNMSQHYLTLSFDMRGPHRQCRFPISISRPLHRPLHPEQRRRRRQAPGARGPDPCSLPSHLCTERPFALLSSCQSQATDGKWRKAREKLDSTC